MSVHVTTKRDAQLGTVVSLSSKSDYLVMNSLKSRCISDPSRCKQGITVEFWLRFRGGELIFSFIAFNLLSLHVILQNAYLL